MEYPTFHMDKSDEKVLSIPESNIIQSTSFTESSMNEGTHSKNKRTKKSLVVEKFLENWNKMFVLACVIAVSLDPLFFYIPIINQEKKCILRDETLTIFAVLSRLVTDITFVLDMIYMANGSKKAFPIAGSLRLFHILVNLLAIIPVPQVAFLVLFPKLRGPEALDIRKCLELILLSQYVLRVLRIYFSSKELTRTSDLLTGRINNSVWVKGAFNFFLYILASHVFGAFWYFFSFQRLTTCWHKACSKYSGCDFLHGCYGDTLESITFLDRSCPVNVNIANTTAVFDFGIFMDAIQSGLLESYDFPNKLSFSFWWGLRNLSSLGQNLKTSTYVWENCLAVYISISGLLLFLYLIGNLQTYLQLATTRKEKIRHLMKKIDIELWIIEKGLPKERKTEITVKVQKKLRENKNVDLENLLSVLPLEDRKPIKRQLCLPLLMMIPTFERMYQQVLTTICDHAKPVIYRENSFVIREGEPLDQMIFIMRGSAWSYSTVWNFSGGSSNSNSSIRRLKKGDYFGEQLLDWLIKGKTTFSDFPISTTNLKSHTKVEAFVLSASDLMKAKERFPTHFMINFPESVDSLKTAAASAIQKAWHRHTQEKKSKISRYQNNGSSQRFK